MTREDPLIRVRLPEQLKAQVQAAAADARRSMNAEIVSRLEATFTNNAPSGDDLRQRVAVLESELETVQKQMRWLENEWGQHSKQ